MMTNMTWEAILGIRAWTPLCEVTTQRKMVLPGVFQVAETAYLVTQPYNRTFEQNRPDAPFITMGIWAGSQDALKRCIDSDATVQVSSLTSKPPDALLLGTQGEYAELESHIPQAQRRIAERAVYSNDGAFVHKVIEIERFRFCFLNHQVAKQDRVYVIEVDLL